MADIQFPNTLFGPGSFSATLLDNNGAPASVLEASDPATVQATWSIGALAALLLGGEWEVDVYVESIGPGTEARVASSGPIPLTGAQTYNATLTILANTLPNDPNPPTGGVYKLVSVLIHRNFGAVSNVAAVVEGPVVRIA